MLFVVCCLLFVVLGCDNSGGAGGLGLPVGSDPALPITGPTVAEQLEYLQINAQPGAEYEVWVYNNEELSGLWTGNLATDNNITVHIRSRGSVRRVLTLDAPGTMLDIGANTLVLQNVELEGLSGNANPLVTVSGDGRLNMGNGSIIRSNGGRGVSVSGGGILNMESGSEVRGNQDGGLAITAGGTVYMNGVISGNTTSGRGGGVYVNQGTLYIGATASISGNTSGNWGAGVSVRGANGIVHMNGGIIGGNANTAPAAPAGGGGGVAVYGGSNFFMHNGTIGGAQPNTSVVSGGGVVIQGANSTFTMFGGIIENNRTENNGGGVHINAGSIFNMGSASEGSTGIIRNNTALSNGGAVSMTSNGTPVSFNMFGGAIVGNRSGYIGNGAFISSADRNHGVGGGVSVYNRGTFNMYSGIIKENEAAGDGGGVRLSPHSPAEFCMFRGGSGDGVIEGYPSNRAGRNTNAPGDGHALRQRALATVTLHDGVSNTSDSSINNTIAP